MFIQPQPRTSSLTFIVTTETADAPAHFTPLHSPSLDVMTRQQRHTIRQDY